MKNSSRTSPDFRDTSSGLFHLAPPLPQLVDDLFKGEGKALRIAVGAMVGLVETMERVVHARMMVSVAHRLFSEPRHRFKIAGDAGEANRSKCCDDMAQVGNVSRQLGSG